MAVSCVRVNCLLRSTNATSATFKHVILILSICIHRQSQRSIVNLCFVSFITFCVNIMCLSVPIERVKFFLRSAMAASTAFFSVPTYRVVLYTVLIVLVVTSIFCHFVYEHISVRVNYLGRSTTVTSTAFNHAIISLENP